MDFLLAVAALILYAVSGLGVEILMPFRRDGSAIENAVRLLIVLTWPAQLLIVGAMVVLVQFEKPKTTKEEPAK